MSIIPGRTRQSRRRFLTTLSMAGVGLLAAPKTLRAEAPPETSVVRLGKVPGVCFAPQYVAEELLHSEGFSDVRYVESASGVNIKKMARGEVDLSLVYSLRAIAAADSGDPITVLAGVHAGCFELFGTRNIRNIVDLKGKSVGVESAGTTPHELVSLMASNVGLDPTKDINWVTSPSAKPMKLFVDGRIDAFLALPPEPQELRARKIGHVILNSSVDQPWSEYFCCMFAGNSDFIQAHPIATKRALRAILKAADLCVSDPKGVAQQLVGGGFAARYDYALEALSEVSYRWRDYDPEDTLRFYALRMRELGMIRSNPQEIIVAGTNWRFLDELKRELKG